MYQKTSELSKRSENTQYNAEKSERIIALYVSRIIPDLLTVKLQDYIDYINLESHASIKDIVESCTELHFITGSVQYNYRAKFNSMKHSVTLGMRFNNPDVNLEFDLTFHKKDFQIELDNINCPANYYIINDEILHQAFKESVYKSGTIAIN